MALRRPKYEIREAEGEQFYYVLVGGNGEVMNIGEMHDSVWKVVRAIRAAKRASRMATIDLLTRRRTS